MEGDIKMKKIVGLCIAILASATLFVGCGDQSPKETDKGNVGDYYIEIRESKVSYDSEDNDILVVQYEFTNNSDHNQNFYFSTSRKYFQDGIQLDPVMPGKMTEEYKNNTKDIQPGATITVEDAVRLNNTDSPVDIELTPLMGQGSGKVSKTFTMPDNEE